MCVCVRAEGAQRGEVRGAWGMVVMVVMGVCEVKVGGLLPAGGEVLEDKKIRWRLNKRCI